MRSIGARCGCAVLLPLGLGSSNGYYVHPSSSLPLSSHVSRRPPPADVVVRHRRQTRPPRASPHVMYLSSTSSSSSSSSSPPEALGTCGNWSAYIDESKGLVYYFNPRTGESRWEPPSGTDFSDVRTNIGTTKRREMRTRLRNYLEDRLNESASEFVGSFSDTSVVDDGSRTSGGARTNVIGRTNNIVAGGGNAETRNKYIVSEWGRYQALIDDKRGLIYYHDTWTRESSWERPEGFPPFKLSASRRIALEERNRRYLEWHGDSDGGNMPQGSDENAAVVSDANHSNDGTMESPEFAPELDAGASRTNNDFLNWKSGDLAVVSYSNSSGDVGGGSSWSTTGFEMDAAQTNGVVDAFVSSGEGKIDPDQPLAPPSIANPSPALPTMTVDDNGNDVNTLPIVRQGDWSAYFDVKSGLVFYFNEETSETSWDPPVQNFPRIVMDASGPSVLDPGYGNISMERAIGYIGVDEMAEALAWEEAKKKERARKAAEREANGGSRASEGDGGTVKNIYEAAKTAELERIDQDRTMTAEQKTKEDAAKLVEEDKQLAGAASKFAIQESRDRLTVERLDQERIAMEQELERERLNNELLDIERLKAERNSMSIETDPKRPVPPKVERSGDGVGGILSFWWGRKRTSLKTRTLYDVLLCSPGSSRDELKRSYLSLAKETHPDALLQSGLAKDEKTEKRFTEIAQAWKILGDPMSRRRYDRELQAKGISSTAGNIFEALVMGAAQALDEVLAKAEESLES